MCRRYIQRNGFWQLYLLHCRDFRTYWISRLHQLLARALERDDVWFMRKMPWWKVERRDGEQLHVVYSWEQKPNGCELVHNLQPWDNQQP
jgi:hypothetical protein